MTTIVLVWMAALSVLVAVGLVVEVRRFLGSGEDAKAQQREDR